MVFAIASTFQATNCTFFFIWSSN